MCPALLLLAPRPAASELALRWDLRCDAPVIELANPLHRWTWIEGLEPSGNAAGRRGAALEEGGSLLLLLGAAEPARTLRVKAHSAGRKTSLAAFLNGHDLGERRVGRRPRALTWPVTAVALRRGPNVLRLVRGEARARDGPRVILRRVGLEPRHCAGPPPRAVPVDAAEPTTLGSGALLLIPVEPSAPARLELSFSTGEPEALLDALCYTTENVRRLGSLKAVASRRAIERFRLDDGCAAGGLALLSRGPGAAANVVARVAAGVDESPGRASALGIALLVLLLIAGVALTRRAAGHGSALEWLPLILLCLWVALWAPRGHFSGDFGVKLAQSQALWESGFGSRALPYDLELDPDGAFHPFDDAFLRQVGDSIQGIYSVVFAALAAPFIAGLGLNGTIVTGLVGAFLTALGVLRMARQLGLPVVVRFSILAGTLLLTPILFYSSQLSEYTLATGLVVVALSLVTPLSGGATRRPAVAGLLAALAATLRPEGYCLVASLGLVIVLAPDSSRRRRVSEALRYLGGAVPVLLAFWALNLATSGTWDLLVTATRGGPAAWNAAETARYLLVGWVEGTWIWFVAPALALLVGLLPPALRRRLPRIAVHLVVAVAIAAAALAAQNRSLGPVPAGLFSVTPLAAYGLLAGPWDRRLRPPWLFSVSYLAQVLTLERSFTAAGLELGARHLMPLLPVLLLLAGAVAREDWRGFRPRRLSAAALAPVAALLLATGLAMGGALPGAVELSRDAEIAVERVNAMPADVVVTSRWWEGQILAPVLLRSKRLHFAADRPRELFERLADRGVRLSVLIAEDERPIRLAGGGAARTVERWPGWLQVRLVVIKPPTRRATSGG